MAENEPQGGNPAEALQKLLEKKNGDMAAVAMTLLSENFDLRGKNRDLKGKVPADGSVILSKDEAADYEAFRSLNLKPAEVKSKIEAHDTVSQENATLKKESLLRGVADAGYSYDALKDFDQLEGGLEYILKDETRDGKTVRTVMVKKDGKERPFDDYAKEARPALAPILKSSGTQGGGTPMVPQSPGGKTPAKDIYEQTRQRTKERQEQKSQGSSVHERFGLKKTA